MLCFHVSRRRNWVHHDPPAPPPLSLCRSCGQGFFLGQIQAFLFGAILMSLADTHSVLCLLFQGGEIGHNTTPPPLESQAKPRHADFRGNTQHQQTHLPLWAKSPRSKGARVLEAACHASPTPPALLGSGLLRCFFNRTEAFVHQQPSRIFGKKQEMGAKR